MNRRTTITAEIEITFHYDPALPHVLTLEMPHGYIATSDGELYFDEHDGTRFSSLWPALAPIFPKGAKAETNGRNEAWISHYNNEALAWFDGRRFTIRYTEEIHHDGEFSERAELLN